MRERLPGSKAGAVRRVEGELPVRWPVTEGGCAPLDQNGTDPPRPEYGTLHRQIRKLFKGIYEAQIARELETINDDRRVA